MEKVTFLIPCRKGSERVPHKNIKPFAKSSLLEIKIEQIKSINRDVEIIISTDDDEVVEKASKYDDILIHKREDYFASSGCTTTELCDYFSKELSFKHLLWTHTTSPFIGREVYERAIDYYFSDDFVGFDSLMSVEKCQEFIWDKSCSAKNYDVEKLGRWPQTQKVDPLYIINSGFFLISKEVMVKHRDRVGEKPYFFETNKLESLDIDWPSDFVLAEKLWKVM